jgi:ABC-type transport system involved in cytochrome bd biosynthesis fused ATPase/permease subunit
MVVVVVVEELRALSMVRALMMMMMLLMLLLVVVACTHRPRQRMGEPARMARGRSSRSLDMVQMVVPLP